MVALRTIAAITIVPVVFFLGTALIALALIFVYSHVLNLEWIREEALEVEAKGAAAAASIFVAKSICDSLLKSYSGKAVSCFLWALAALGTVSLVTMSGKDLAITLAQDVALFWSAYVTFWKDDPLPMYRNRRKLLQNPASTGTESISHSEFTKRQL